MAARRIRMYERIINLDLHRARTFRERVNPMEDFISSELYDRFRFTRQGIVYLLRLLQNCLLNNTRRSQAIAPALKLFLTLRFLATGSFQILIGDDCGVSQPTVSRTVWHVIYRIAALAPRFIKYQKTENEKNKMSQKFYQLAGIPGIISLIDCTRIRILRPLFNEDVFVNRKNYHSINVQATMDCDFKYTSVTAKFPGSMHDSAILQESALFEHHERLDDRKFLLGDSGYPCKKWLLTPHCNPAQGSPQDRFNR